MRCRAHAPREQFRQRLCVAEDVDMFVSDVHFGPIIFCIGEIILLIPLIKVDLDQNRFPCPLLLSYLHDSNGTYGLEGSQVWSCRCCPNF